MNSPISLRVGKTRKNEVFKKSRRNLLLLATVLVIIAVNAFFVGNYIVTSGKLMSLINSNTNDVNVHYSSASGTLLTEFRFKDLDVHGEDSHVKWQVKIQDATLVIPVWRLYFKTFQTNKLIGSGFAFQLTFKEQKEQKSPQNGSNQNDEGYKNNERLHFGGIHLEKISEIIIGSTHLPLSPNAVLDADFHFWPGYEIKINPSHLQDETPNHQLDMKFHLANSRFKENPGFTILRNLTADLTLKGDSPSPSFLGAFFKTGSENKLEGGPTHLDASLQIVNGELTPPSRLLLTLNPLEYKSGRFRASGPTELEFRDSVLGVRLRDFQIQPLPVRVADLNLKVATHKVNITDPLAQVRQISVAAQDLSGSALKTRFKTDLHLDTEVSETAAGKYPWKFSELNLALTELQLSDRRRPGTLAFKDWRGKVILTDAGLRPGGSPGVSGKVQLRFEDGKPIFAVLQNMGVLPFNFSGLLPMRNLDLSSTVALDPDRLQFDEIALRSSTLQADGNLLFKEGKRFGTLKVAFPNLSVQLAFQGDTIKLGP